MSIKILVNVYPNSSVQTKWLVKIRFIVLNINAGIFSFVWLLLRSADLSLIPLIRTKMHT